MSKLKTTVLAGRKGVRLGPNGGSILEVIPVRICLSMPELIPYFSHYRSLFSEEGS